MSRSPEATRARLITAAEQLFAARGIDAVSLREINRAAGARNAIAVQYHFDDRAGVLRAILGKHRPDVEARRHAMLGPFDRVLGGGFGGLKGLLGATLFFLLANLATDMVYGPEAERPQWMTKSITYPLLNASGRAIVDWVEARRGHPRVEAGR